MANKDTRSHRHETERFMEMTVAKLLNLNENDGVLVKFPVSHLANREDKPPRQRRGARFCWAYKKRIWNVSEEL